jgi:Domain of unknown function (DUF4412)
MNPRFVGVFIFAALSSIAGAEPAFEGTINATYMRGREADKSTVLFTRQGGRVRIENTTNKLEPINILDLATSRLTIVYPHNTTFVVADLAKNSGDIPMPATPQMPNHAIAGAVGMGVPQMPPVPGPPGQTELKKTDQTKKIQGFDCTLYVIENRGEKFEIWATGDAALFPFHLIERDGIRARFGPRTLEEQWIEVLRNNSLFPLEASLRMTNDAKTEQLSFKIDKIEKRKIADDSAFRPPEEYQEMPAPES